MHEVLDPLNQEGTAARNRGDYEAAQRAWLAALKYARAHKDRRHVAVFLNNLGLVCSALGKPNRAIRRFSRALKIFVRLKEPTSCALCLYNLSVEYNQLGRFEQAIKANKQACRLWEEVGDARGRAECQIGIGVTYWYQGAFDEAEKWIQSALGIIAQHYDPLLAAEGFSSLAHVYADKGQFARAHELFHGALAHYEEAEQLAPMARCLSGLGRVYWRLGLLEEARAMYQRALEIRERLGLPQELATTLNSIGTLYDTLEDYEQAARYYERALALFEELQDQQNIAVSLNNLGNVAGRCGWSEEARQYLKLALALREEQQNSFDIARSLNSLGVIDQQEGKYRAALQRYRQALKRFEQAGNLQDVATTQANLGGIYERQGRRDLAIKAYEEAIQNFEALGEQVGDAEQSGAFQEINQRNLYARCALVLLHKGREADALLMVERGRAQGLARQAAQNQLDWQKILASEDATALTEKQQQVHTAYQELRAAARALSLATGRDGEKARLRQTEAERTLQKAQSALRVLRVDLAEKYPAVRRLSGMESLTFSQFQELASRHPDTLYLEWAFVEDRTLLLFALSEASGLHAFAYSIPGEPLSTHIERWRNTLFVAGNTRDTRRREAEQTEVGTEQEEAQRLYQLLLQPLEVMGLLDEPRYRRLVLVGEGALWDIPFAALQNPVGKRLIEQRALSLSVSLHTLLWPVERPPAHESLLCIAAPNAGQVFTDPLRGTFLPLTYAAEEGEAIVKLFAGAQLLKGTSAQKKEVLDRIGSYRILHFATHGWLHQDNGLLSALLLAPPPPDDPESGFLEAREIMNRRLGADMTVFSACRTGLGRRRGGDGPVGLVWACLSAGCPTSVASLWSVEDRSTAQLMVAFYSALQTGIAKDLALQQAIGTILRTRGRSSPYFWAGFQVYGDTRPLESVR